MKYIDGYFNRASLDSIKQPELIQRSTGENGGLCKYGSDPRSDGMMARHLRDYDEIPEESQ